MMTREEQAQLARESGLEWAKWFEQAERHVAKDDVNGVSVSTVFLGLDHAFGESQPLLFETMVFGGDLNQEQARYSTWDEAETGHKETVARICASSSSDGGELQPQPRKPINEGA